MWLWQFTDEIYLGFAVFIIISYIIRFKDESTRTTITKMRNIAAIVVAVTATFYVLIWIPQLQITDRMTGRYWYGYWIYPFVYGLLPQLFWVKRFRTNKIMLMISACLILFVLYIEKAVILFTIFHRDF